MGKQDSNIVRHDDNRNDAALPLNRQFPSLAALYLAEEAGLCARLANIADIADAEATAIAAQAHGWVAGLRADSSSAGVIDAFLQEYGLSTDEGIILMRLSEALIRTPDFATARALMRDKLSSGDWAEHAGASPVLLINSATIGLRLTSAWISATGGNAASNLAARLGDRVLGAAVERGMGIMAEHFVLGSSIENALRRGERGDALHSFDMLGEGACTAADAERYFASYSHAARSIGQSSRQRGTARENGLSVKLSALHPEYHWAKREQCVPALVERIVALVQIARAAGIGINIDAEEADRLELSLLIFDALIAHPAVDGWDGLGIVVQAYGRRATAVIDHLVHATRAAGQRIAVRLVKGAYWDAEIKRAQSMGLDSYPVFTRKEHTDLSFIACARQLLAATDVIYPQFATHNAHTAAAIVAMAPAGSAFEFQRLHGMGEALHQRIAASTGIASRVYAPVGRHKELLPYLVRRLLENGANSSFVNQLLNPDMPIAELVRDPIALARGQRFSPNPSIPAPRDMFGGTRMLARGMDLTQADAAAAAEALPGAAPVVVAGTPRNHPSHVRNPAQLDDIVGTVHPATAEDVTAAIHRASSSTWADMTSAAERGVILSHIADRLEAQMPQLMGLCVREAGKSLPDAVDEVREAVDFCRYYAEQAETPAALARAPLGVVVCISPWNFPLAIFVGQVAAALVMGNRVLAKPAPQTPLIAAAAVAIMHECGVPQDALQLLPGGPEVGAALTGHAGVDGVCFTGSTATARRIADARIGAHRADAPLIAETGGINAMIVDSTALLEQAVHAVVSSAFQSAGQRCSACRIVCVQDDVTDNFEAMLAGAIALLDVGNPAHLLTDVGPIIDDTARTRIHDYIAAKCQHHRVIAQAPMDAAATNGGFFVAPIAIAVNRVADVGQEIFGPVLHVVRFAADALDDTVAAINALGYGLTLGLHTRIDGRMDAVAHTADIGNIYINRNQIGAVVGVQPFGGHGLSGTGPKAGGPHYLLRLSQPRARAAATPITMDDRAGSATRAIAPVTPATLAAMRAAQSFWAATPTELRVERVAALCNALAVPADDALRTIATLARTVTLPGPTGEDNRLELHPRGLLIASGGDMPLRQAVAAIAAGSGALLFCEAAGSAGNAATALAAAVLRAGIPAALIGCVDAPSLSTLGIDAVKGVVADAPLAPALASALAGAAALLPVMPTTHDHYRLFAEKTVTIDTTAAGGNASLLANQ